MSHSCHPSPFARSAALAVALLAIGPGHSRAQDGEPVSIVIPPDSAGCVQCHERGQSDSPATPGIVAHWRASAHAAVGIGCVDCHGVPAPDARAQIENPRYVVVTTGTRRPSASRWWSPCVTALPWSARTSGCTAERRSSRS